MAEKDKELENSVKEIPGLVKKLKEWFSKEQKFSEIKVGDKTFSYSGETFAVGVDIKDCPDGDYETETHKFSVKEGKVTDYKAKEAPAAVTIAVDATEFKATIEAFEQKFAAQKIDFDREVKEIKAAFDKKFDELVKGKLKEIFDIVERIAALPQVDSQFKKKDGEPNPPASEDRMTKIMAEAKKTITDKIFQS